jgi:Putative lactococcus lactis phage r1t holin
MPKTSLLTKVFWFATVERAVKTFAQTLVAVLSAGQLGLFDVAWVKATSTAALGAVMSVLTSVGSARTAGDGPSLGAEVMRPAAGAGNAATTVAGPSATESNAGTAASATALQAPALVLSD